MVNPRWAWAMAIGHCRPFKAIGAGVAGLSLVLAASALASPGGDLFHFDSAYQTVRIVEEKEEGANIRIMLMSGGRASGLNVETGETSFASIRVARKLVVDTKARNLLVIGSAGFNLPRDAAALPLIQYVDAVDVDPAVKGIAEMHFLKHPLSDKVRFLPLSARFAVRKLRKQGARYDFTFIDAYFGRGIPEELATVEFFEDVRRISERTSANVIMDRALKSEFACNLLSSFRQAFGHVWVIDTKRGDE